ncbi:MAG TPA: DUF4062 domain-containing protein [Thermoanaerobaculia bacterium]|nr:DUF4062 domain-containing protein [Thermoanaerobaculia bacterium]
MSAERQGGRTFRVFVSSTFSDLKAERNALQQYVFPRLRELCARHGCRFQAIDLRWGVRDEAALDQQTMRICIEEIHRCQRTSRRPNFIVLLGDRYGWAPLPAAVREDEFEALVREDTAGDVRQWYRRDDNNVPVVYRLLPRTGEFAAASRWSPIEQRLRQAFERAFATRLMSATEQEIAEGVDRAPDAADHVFAFVRDIDNLNELARSDAAGTFLDLTADGAVDAEAHARLYALKGRLERALGGNFHRCRARWTEREDLTADHIGTLPATLDECLAAGDSASGLCGDVWRSLSRVILEEIAELRQTDPLQREIQEQRAFGEDRARLFVGRTATLRKIVEYPRQGHPLVITGRSGCGKSAILARAAADCRLRNPGAAVIVRFIGATPESSEGRSLLGSLCHEIAACYGAAPVELPDDYRALVAAFHRHAAMATSEKPLHLFLDALDQLSAGDQARNLLWLPAQLPPHVFLVVSTLPDDAAAVLERKTPPENFVSVPDMSVAEGEELLSAWLADAGRTLQPEQREEVIGRFRACPLPLYLKVAFEEAKRWKSYDGAVSLRPDVESMIRELFARLSLDTHHGPTLVAESLGLLAASKNGLSEDEMLDLLSRSDAVIEDVAVRAHHQPPARLLPVVIWSRLYFDLQPYLTERRADGARLMTFYHRQLASVAAELYLQERGRIRHHRALARYFETRLLQDLRKLSELPYQQVHGRMWDDLRGTLCDLEFLHAKSEGGMVFDAINDYELALDAAEHDPAAPPELRELVSELAVAFSQEFHAFQSRPRTTAQQIYNNLHVQNGAAGPAGAILADFAGRRFYPSGVWLRRDNVAPATSTSRALLRTIAAQNGAVTALAVSPGGTLIACGGTDGMLHVLRQRDGALLGSMAAHEGGVTGIAWLGAGEEARLCSAGRDQHIRVWEWRLESEVHSWTAHADVIRGLAASPAGTLATCSDDRTVRIWDPSDGRELAALRGSLDRVMCVAAGEGPALFSGGEDRCVRMWSADPPRELGALRGPTDTVRCVAVEPRGAQLVSGGDDRVLRLWNLQSGRERALGKHAQRINCAGLLRGENTNATLAATGSDDETVRIWSARSGEELHVFRGHSGPVNALGTDPAGRWLVTGGEDGTLRVWRPGAEIAAEQGATEHAAQVNGLAAGAGGATFVSASEDGTAKVWRSSDGALIATLRGHSAAVTAVMAVDRLLVSASADHTLRVWKALNGEPLRTLGSTAPLTGKSSLLWRNEERERKGHVAGVTALARIGRGVVSGSRDGSVRQWDIEAGEEIRAFTGAHGVIETLIHADDAGLLIATGSSADVAVWTVDDAKAARLLNGHSSRIACAAYDRGVLVTGSLDTSVRVWDPASGRCQSTFHDHTDWVTAVAVDTAAGIAVSGSRDGSIMVWDLAGGRCRSLLNGHTAGVRGLAIDAARGRLISYGDDQWLVVWSLGDGSEIAAVHLDSRVTALLTISPEQFCVGTARGGIALLRLETPARARGQWSGSEQIRAVMV